MRSLLVIALLGGAGGVAHAEQVAGTYDVKYETTANNCPTEYLKFARGDLKIEVKGNSMSIGIERVPMMTGLPSKVGKITAKSRPQGGHTAVAGMDGVFSVAGRVQNGLLSLVFVGEYQTEKDHKPLCTQSWNITGVRKDDAPAGSGAKK
jgi:hypothetical protein